MGLSIDCNFRFEITLLVVDGIGLPFGGVGVNFLIPPELMLFAEVELTNKVDSHSLTSIISSMSVSASSY